PIPSNAEDRRMGFADEVIADGVFPGVGFKAGVLFGGDDLLFEVRAGPPGHAVLIVVHGLGEELVAVAGQSDDVDGADPDGPKPSSAGFVAEIGGFVGGADKDALPRLDHFLAAVAGPVAFIPSREKGL